MIESNFRKILSAGESHIEAVAEHNGGHYAVLADRTLHADVQGIPTPYAISGEWHLVLEGGDFQRVEKLWHA